LFGVRSVMPYYNKMMTMMSEVTVMMTSELSAYKMTLGHLHVISECNKNVLLQ